MIKINPKNRNVIILLVIISSLALVLFATQFSTVPEAQYWENFGEAYVVEPIWEGNAGDLSKTFVIDQIINFNVMFAFNVKGTSNPTGVDTSGFEDLDYWLEAFQVRITDENGQALEGITFKPDGTDYRGYPKKTVEDIMYLPEFGKYTFNIWYSYTVMYWDESIQIVNGQEVDFGSWWKQSYTNEKYVDFYYHDPAVYPDPDNPNDPKWEIFDEPEPSGIPFDFSFFMVAIITILAVKRYRHGKLEK